VPDASLPTGNSSALALRSISALHFGCESVGLLPCKKVSAFGRLQRGRFPFFSHVYVVLLEITRVVSLIGLYRAVLLPLSMPLPIKPYSDGTNLLSQR